MNYLVINKPSNLVLGVISSSYTPTNNKVELFVKAGDKTLDTYYKWCRKNPGLLPDLGEILARSKYLNDLFLSAHSTPIKINNNQRYRESVPSGAYTFDELNIEREKLFANYISDHPNISFSDLSDVMNCGICVAKAYLRKYSYQRI